ncbi:MAG: membrane-associated PAP2 superfamily phosphatase [Cellvibrionaceae bacterium]
MGKTSFALLALYYLAQIARRRKQAIIFALSLGWLMGAYKMLIGHHFLSHTIISMVLAWFLVNSIALLVYSLSMVKQKFTPKSRRGSSPA